MKKCYFLFAILLIGSIEIYSQPYIKWQTSLGGSGIEMAGELERTFDGGFILTGFTYSNDGDVTGSHGGKDAWIVKLDNIGNLVWQKAYGGTGTDQLSTALPLEDSTFILVGSSKSNNGDVNQNYGSLDGWVVCIDSGGTILWENNYGGTGGDSFSDIVQTNDGFLVVGSSTSNDIDVTGNYGNKDVWAVKIDSLGNIIWEQNFGGSLFDEPIAVKNTYDMGFIIIGTSQSNDIDLSGNLGGNDFLVLKIDSVGNLQWSKSLGGSGYDQGYDITQTFDSSFVITGWTKSNDGYVSSHYGPLSDEDIWCVKLNSQGNIIWEKSIGGSNIDQGYQIIQLIDSTYLISGTTYSSDFDVSFISENNDAWIVNLDTSGNIKWEKTFSQGGWESIHDIVELQNNNLVFHSIANKNGNQNYWTVELSCSYYSSDSVLICQGDSILIYEVYQNTAGIYYDSLQTTNGCDSILSTTLTVNPIFSSNQNNSICQGDSLLIYGIYQNTAGIYYDSLQTINGCDSILSTTLSVNPIFTSNQSNSICQGDSLLIYGNYQNTAGVYYDSLQTINGCDSILSTTLTINPVFTSNQNNSICQGDSILLYGNYQNAAGVYYDSLQTINGCDSLFSTTLTLNPLPNVTLANINPDTLCETANAVTLPTGSPSGGNYSGNGVGGGNFNPTTAGVGTHDIIYTYTDGNSCINSDTTIITVDVCAGIDNINTDFGIIIYPNPSTGQFTIEKPNNLNEEVQVKLLDATSKLILEKVIPIGQQKVEMDIRNYSKGIYYLHIIVDDEHFVKQILKN
jgi:hypothetical protein